MLGSLVSHYQVWTRQRVFPEEIIIWISRINKENLLSPIWQAPSNLLRARIEQKY
jgi:hypothetical protein